MGEIDLLFFDTFAHENSEELNLDLVQFPKPVYVTEVRIIPLGARVQADFPGGVRLGATNPSQFSIEFFVNDLGKPGASTFESLGGFDYNQNGCINLECVPNEAIRKIPTDGLVLRGWYTTITLAVYGILTVNVPEQIIQPVVSPAIPPQPNSLPELQQIIPVTPIKNEWPQDNIQAVPIEYTQQPAVAYPPSYGTTDQYSQEYSEYYSEIPKDPRSYHNTPETDWDNKNRVLTVEPEIKSDIDRYQKTGSLEREHSRLETDRRERDRHYVRSHSQDRDRSRDYADTSRERSRDRDWEFERGNYRDHKDVEWDRERDRDRPYKHPDTHRRTYGREDREEARKRPRTPPTCSPKRPHTPHAELSPKEIEPVPESEKVQKEDNGQSPVNEESAHAVEEFEPILSDEDILDDSEHYQDLDYDYTAYTNNDDIIKLFIPGSTVLKKYERSPSFKVSLKSIEISNNLKSAITIADDFFKSSITKYVLSEFENLNVDIKEEFIHICEKISSTIGEDEIFCDIAALYVIVKSLECEDYDESSKEIIAQTKFVVETLLDWIKIALDYHMANSQNLPAYKIRHIKCGVRLADWCCNSVDFIKMLWNQSYDVADILLYLYSREYMALSIKLMILHALDTYLLHKPAIERFTSATISSNVKENGVSNSEDCGYKKLIEIMLRNPLVRLKFALQSILKKLNLFESLSKLQDAAARGRRDQEIDVTLIIKLLNQILDLYRNGPLEISQPKRFLPAAAQFDINRCDLKNLFLRMFDAQNLLSCCALLLTLPKTMNLSSVKTPILELLTCFLQSKEGMLYLYDNCDSVNTLLKVLLQSDEIIQYSMPFSVEIEGHILGLRMAYALQCQYHVDYLLDNAQAHKFDCDASTLLDQLHCIYCLTFSSVGKVTCSQVLGFDQNLQCLVQFFEVLHVKEKSEQQLSKIKKSPGLAYICDLIAFTVVYNSDVTFLERNAKHLLHVVNQQELFDDSVIARINEFAPYVKPFETLTLASYDNVGPIIEVIVKHLENVIAFPGQLVTCLRILDHLGISKHARSDNGLNNYVELKYKHVIIQLYALDGLATLTSILQKICKFYEQPSIHLATFVANQSINIINVVKPCIDLLKQMLTYVIQCRNTNYKDLTSVPVLLQTYNLLRTFPSNSPVYFKARKLCEKIIEALLVYTQPVSDEISENDLLNKTLWAQMCGEVIKYINLAPYTFISGLLVFSELLPLPLPLQTREPLTPEEVSWAVNLRKLWAAHLHIYSSNIQELINRMCTSTHPPLLNLLRKVCIQLADLASNSAIMIAKGILDTVHADLSTESDVLTQPSSGNVARLLNFLACLVTHNSLKCAILSLLQNKAEEKYSSIIPSFAKILSYSSSTNSHVQAQECILSIIQSLCDTEITLLQNEVEITNETYLADSLPIKDTLLSFITMMVDHLSCDNTFVTYLPIIRTLLLLMEHDYGFYHLREHLLKKSDVFAKVLNKTVEGYSKENEDCLSVISSLVEFFRICLIPDEVPDPLTGNLRTMKMNVGEVQSMLGWTGEQAEGAEQHALLRLENVLLKSVTEESFDNYIHEGVKGIIALLKEITKTKETPVEPILPPPQSLLLQFSARSIFTLTDVIDEQLTTNYWLSVPAYEPTTEVDNVTCDLGEVCRQHLPADINIIREVEKVCRIYSSNNNEQDDAKTKGAEEQKEKNKKSFVVPIARRGFPYRQVQVRADLFRSRPPNTSRPPSLHVDDFVALETCGAQPTGPTGYNKISRELLATSRVTRGTRGRSFVNAERSLQQRQICNRSVSFRSWWSAGLNRRPY
ncbi:protein virilizer isoform X1 [Photinus pyralis]|uniref:protein virilizer isoform X1 n=1 Tax=Photinus pyralis TaxID=7054 RepID=UPI00126750BD|nr:protein virilizer isoform X1 [Photinus pyralis]